MRPSRRPGFTLVELLIVVVVLGILATIAIARFWQVKEDAFITAMKTDLRNLANNQEIYHSSNNLYANDPLVAGLTSSDGVTVQVNEATGQGWAATATHTGMPTAQCGYFTGNALPANAIPATVSGVIACVE